MSKWKARCYSDDIPDHVPVGVQKSMKAPSYKAIALAILNNDLSFHSIGFSRVESSLSISLMKEMKKTNQISLL